MQSIPKYFTASVHTNYEEKLHTAVIFYIELYSKKFHDLSLAYLVYGFLGRSGGDHT